MRGLRWSCVFLTAVLLAACSAPASISPPQSGPTVGPSSPGIRGTQVSTSDCPNTYPTGSRPTPVRVSGTVVQYLICPTVGLNGVTGAGHSVGPRVVNADNRAIFDAMTHALSSPDVVDPSVSVCPAKGQLPIVILIRTTAGVYSAHLPVDSCGLYLSAVIDAFQAAEK